MLAARIEAVQNLINESSMCDEATPSESTLDWCKRMFPSKFKLNPNLERLDIWELIP